MNRSVSPVPRECLALTWVRLLYHRAVCALEEHGVTLAACRVPRVSMENTLLTLVQQATLLAKLVMLDFPLTQQLGVFRCAIVQNASMESGHRMVLHANCGPSVLTGHTQILLEMPVMTGSALHTTLWLHFRCLATRYILMAKN